MAMCWIWLKIWILDPFIVSEGSLLAIHLVINDKLIKSKDEWVIFLLGHVFLVNFGPILSPSAKIILAQHFACIIYPLLQVQLIPSLSRTCSEIYGVLHNISQNLPKPNLFHTISFILYYISIYTLSIL